MIMASIMTLAFAVRFVLFLYRPITGRDMPVFVFQFLYVGVGTIEAFCGAIHVHFLS